MLPLVKVDQLRPLALCIQGLSLGYRSVSGLAMRWDRGLDLQNKVKALRSPTSFPCLGVVVANHHRR